MFVGHAMLAFALVGALASRVTGRRRALVLATVAAAYAAVPDVDILYAPVGVWLAVVGGTLDPLALAGSFWATGNLVHRAITHSLVVAPVVAVAVAAHVAARRGRVAADPASPSGSGTDGVAGVASRVAGRRVVAVAPALLGALVVVATAVSGPLGGVVAAAFAVAALGVAEVVARRTDLRPATVAALALVGLATHPFGDLLTGQPPAMAYPLDVVVVAERVTLHPDPTLHLLGAFGAELAAVWAGLVVLLGLTGRLSAVRSLRVVRRGALGTAFAAGVFVLPAPTLELSYPFVFAVLAVGLVGLLPRVGRDRAPAGDAVPPAETDAAGARGDGGANADGGGEPPPVALARLSDAAPEWAAAAGAALAAVTAAWAAYAAAYLLVA